MNRRAALACLLGLPLAAPRPERRAFNHFDLAQPKEWDERVDQTLLCDLPPPILAASPRVLRVVHELAARRRKEST